MSSYSLEAMNTLCHTLGQVREITSFSTLQLWQRGTRQNLVLEAPCVILVVHPLCQPVVLWLSQSILRGLSCRHSRSHCSLDSDSSKYSLKPRLFPPWGVSNTATCLYPELVVPAKTALPVISQETSVAPPIPERSQKQQAAVSNSPMAALGPGGIIASAMGGHPFAPSPNAPPPVLPATHVAIPNVSPQNAPPANLERGQTSPTTYAISLDPSISVIVINGFTLSVPIAGSWHWKRVG